MKTLQELKTENLPHCDWRDFLKVKGESLTEEHIKALDDHFKHFVPPGPCIMCGSRLGAKGVIDALFGGSTFIWGICHGEGICSKCRYPARAYHYDIGPIEKMEIILQYHPDSVK